MKNFFKKDFVIPFFIFTFVIALDQISKGMALKAHLAIINNGFIMGIGENLPAGIRIVTLSSLFGFIFFIYLSLAYLLPKQLFKLKIFLSLFVAGILGNVLDRALRGESIDFIPLHLFNPTYFNFADSFQWLGAILITYQLFKSEKLIWYPKNQRGTFLVNPKEQIKYALKITMASFSASLLLGLFMLAFLQMILPQDQRPTILYHFAISFLALSSIFNGLVFYIGLLLSHRNSGPLYAFEQYVEDLLQGKIRQLSLREGDNHRHLEKIAYELYLYFQNNSKK